MVWFSLSEAIDMLRMGLTLWYGGRRLSFHQYYNGVFWGFCGEESSSHIALISKGISAGRAIYAIGRTELDVSAITVSISGKRETDITVPLVEFHNAVFSYPTRPNKVLSGSNLALHSSQFIVIVGPSGCGKSTIVSLLERFYNLTSGVSLSAE